jgi:hypothetical protein
MAPACPTGSSSGHGTGAGRTAHGQGGDDVNVRIHGGHAGGPSECRSRVPAGAQDGLEFVLGVYAVAEVQP